MNTYIWMLPPYRGVFCCNSQPFPWFDIINLYGTSKVIAILLLTSFLPIFPVLTLASRYCCFKFPDALKDKHRFWVHIKMTADRELGWWVGWSQTPTRTIIVHTSFTRTNGKVAKELLVKTLWDNNRATANLYVLPIVFSGSFVLEEGIQRKDLMFINSSPFLEDEIRFMSTLFKDTENNFYIKYTHIYQQKKFLNSKNPHKQN